MTPPSAEDRMVLDPLIEAVRARIESVSSGDVHASRVHAFDDPLVTQRTYPLRAVCIKLAAPLSDHVVLVGCFREDVLQELSELVVGTLLQQMGCPSAAQDVSLFELEEPHNATDMLDGLWDESTVSFGMPDGDLLVVFTAGFLAGAIEIFQINGGFPGALRQSVRPAPPSAVPTAPAATASPAPATAPEPVPAAKSLDMEDQLAAILGEDAQPDAVPFDAFVDLSGAGGGTSDPLSGDPGPISGAIHSVEVVLSAELGNTRLSLGAISSLNADAVLTLDQRIDEPVQVMVNGVPFATARLVVVGGEYGIEILDVDSSYADIQLAA